MTRNIDYRIKAISVNSNNPNNLRPGVFIETDWDDKFSKVKFTSNTDVLRSLVSDPVTMLFDETSHSIGCREILIGQLCHYNTIMNLPTRIENTRSVTISIDCVGTYDQKFSKDFSKLSDYAKAKIQTMLLSYMGRPIKLQLLPNGMRLYINNYGAGVSWLKLSAILGSFRFLYPDEILKHGSLVQAWLACADKNKEDLGSSLFYDGDDDDDEDDDGELSDGIEASCIAFAIMYFASHELSMNISGPLAFIGADHISLGKWNVISHSIDMRYLKRMLQYRPSDTLRHYIKSKEKK